MKVVGTGSLLGVWVVLLLSASSVIASSQNPTGEYARFKECPLSRPTITDCVYSLSDEGAFKIGKETVPIVNPLIVQGGFEGGGQEIRFFGAQDGNTLSRAPQPVPGGLTGVVAPSWWPAFLREWFDEELDNGVTGVRATVELAGPTEGLTNIRLSTENLLFENGIALGLPVRVHIESPLLGDGCYLGEESDPIQINLTSGTDGNLNGRSGESSFNSKFTVTTIDGGKLVNNSFEVPDATGCGGIFSYFVDSLVNSILGTPSDAGRNSAILEGRMEDGRAEAVKASE